MYSPPSSPLSIGGVIDDGIRLFRQAFSRCWLLAVFPGLILLAFEFAIGIPRVPQGMAGVSALAALGNSPRLMLYDVLAFVVQLLFQGAILVREIAITHGDQSVSLGGALAGSLRRLPGTIGGTILFALIIGACFIPIGISVAYFAARRTLPMSLVMIDLGFVILAVWLWGRLQLWFATLFIEDAGATEALGSSWRLTRGHWWRATTIFTVAVLIILAVAIVFSLIGLAVVSITQTTLMGRVFLLQVFGLMSNAIYYPLGAAIWIAMYHDLKLRREGGDLASRAGALSGAA
jgi:hypothetical protein